MKNLSKNLKHLRNTLKGKVVQDDLARQFGVKPSTYGSYEEGRAVPKLEVLLMMATHFGVSMQDLISLDLSTVSVVESGSRQGGARVLVTTVDRESRDNIELVPVKAAAGYTKGYADVGYIQNLPTFTLPFLDQHRKYRAFAVEGDSMPPVPTGAFVFGHYIDDWKDLKDDSLAIVVTGESGIVFKKAYNYLKDKGCLVLSSTNPLYKPYVVPQEDILEIWGYAGHFSTEF